VVVSKRVAWFLIAFGVWSWLIWPVFLKNIWKDSRSWHHGMTGFFAVHLVLTVVSLSLGTAIGILGGRAVRQQHLTRFRGEALPVQPQQADRG
jgi:hypothetical protein